MTKKTKMAMERMLESWKNHFCPRGKHVVMEKMKGQICDIKICRACGSVVVEMKERAK